MKKRTGRGKGWKCAQHSEDEQVKLDVISKCKKVDMVTE